MKITMLATIAAVTALAATPSLARTRTMHDNSARTTQTRDATARDANADANQQSPTGFFATDLAVGAVNTAGAVTAGAVGTAGAIAAAPFGGTYANGPYNGGPAYNNGFFGNGYQTSYSNDGSRSRGYGAYAYGPSPSYAAPKYAYNGIAMPYGSYAARNGFVCEPGTYFKNSAGRTTICQ